MPESSLSVAPASALAPIESGDELVREFFAGLSEKTQRAYAHDLGQLAAFADLGSTGELAERVLGGDARAANLLAKRWRDSMTGRGLAPATVNRRLSSLRALVRLGRQAGWCSWAVEVRGVPHESYRDTRGPTPWAVGKLFAYLEREAREGGQKGVRDLALVALLYTTAIRRAEAATLDLEHWEPGVRRLWVLRKRARERVALTVPTSTTRRLEAWVRVRGDAPGGLFCRVPVPPTPKQLHPDSITDLVGSLGEAAGFDGLSPHGFRHAAITAALEATGGDVRKVRKFSGHRNVEVLLKYDDAREDVGGGIAEGLAEEVFGGDEA